jgi:hypothetical protein
MTVTVRPVPKRTYQNGIRPFRPVVPANNIRPYTLKTWRPPVPEPLPPAPLLGPKELLGLGVLVLAQIWGYFRRREQLKPSGTSPVQVQGTNGTYQVTTTYITDSTALVRCSDGAVISPASSTSSTSTINVTGYGVQFVAADVTRRGLCGPGTSTGSQINIGEFRAYNADGTLGSPTYRVAGALVGDVYNSTNSRTTRRRVLLDQITRNGVDLTPYEVGDPVPTPEPETAPSISPPPRIPTPLVPEPVQPEQPPDADPSVVPITPGPTAPPAVQPRLPQRTLPPRIPGANATRDGVIVPQAPAPIAVTPSDAHFPIPGGAPVLGNGPQPKPEAIAQELGRIEQKLNILSNPNTDGMGDGSDRMALITNILGRLLEFMTSITAGGGYSLSSPCDVDEAGNPVVSVVEYGGATDALGVLSNKIDALAGVMQIHKNLKQPICKQTPAVGENVTVNFVQVD